MSFYSGAPFFGTLILLLLIALILGCMERSPVSYTHLAGFPDAESGEAFAPGNRNHRNM